MSIPVRTTPKWLPEIGSHIVACLPQENVRSEVLRYIDDDTMEVHLNVMPPMSKSHNYRFRQKVVLLRRKAEPAGEKWVTADSEE